MRKAWLKPLLIVTGCLIFILSLSFDLLHQGSPGIGFQQLVGMTIGLTIILIGLNYTYLSAEPNLFSTHSKRDWLLFVVYLSGVFVVGLWPAESLNIYQNSLLGTDIFNKRDFALNLAGFIPLGYLLLPLIGQILSDNKVIRLVAIAAIVGFSVSLAIECIQYLWVPGRYSSTFDLVTNTFGAVIGALCWLNLKVRQLNSLKA